MSGWADSKFLDALCPNLVQNAAKARHLRAMGLTVIEATNGVPKVLQSNVDRVFGGEEQARQFVASLVSGPPKAPAQSARERFLVIHGGKKAA